MTFYFRETGGQAQHRTAPAMTHAMANVSWEPERCANRHGTVDYGRAPQEYEATIAALITILFRTWAYTCNLFVAEIVTLPCSSQS